MKQIFILIFFLNLFVSKSFGWGDTSMVLSISNKEAGLKYTQLTYGRKIPTLNAFDELNIDEVRFFPNASLPDTQALNACIRWHLNEEILTGSFQKQLMDQAALFWKVKQEERKSQNRDKYYSDEEPEASMNFKSVSFKVFYYSNQYLVCLYTYGYEFRQYDNSTDCALNRVFYFNLETGKEVSAGSLFKPKNASLLAAELSRRCQQKMENNKASFDESLEARVQEIIYEQGETDEEINPEQLKAKLFREWKASYTIEENKLPQLVYMPSPAGLLVLVMPHTFNEINTWVGFQLIFKREEIYNWFEPNPILNACMQPYATPLKNVNVYKQRSPVFEGWDYVLKTNQWREPDARLRNQKVLYYRSANQLTDNKPLYVISYNEWGAPKSYVMVDGNDTTYRQTFTYNANKQFQSLYEAQDQGRYIHTLQLSYDPKGNLMEAVELNEGGTENAYTEKTRFVVNGNEVYEWVETDFFESLDNICTQFRIHEVNAAGMVLRTRNLDMPYTYENKYNAQNKLIASYSYEGNSNDFRLYTYDAAGLLSDIESGDQNYCFHIERNALGNPTEIRQYSSVYLTACFRYLYNTKGLLSEVIASDGNVYLLKYERE